MSDSEFSKPQHLAIGSHKASCPACRALLFVRAQGETAGKPIALACIACGTVTPYTVLLGRLSSAVIEQAKALLAEAHSIRRAVRDAQVDDSVRSRLEEYIARSTSDSRIAIALMKGDRLEYRTVNVSYAAIREGGVQYMGRTYRDVFPEAADAGAEAKLREVIETRQPWKITGFKTAIPGRKGPTWWDGECIPVASNGSGVDSVLVVNWEVTAQVLAAQATRHP
ncbi:MAG: PAS domain-containing protein [Clostridia bacterium]